ncbi:MAG TPA: hypothetical protein VGM12_10415 [Trebonia sp.]
MSGRSSGINKQEIARMMRDMQKEFDRHPIRVPVQADLPELPDISHGTTVTYNGPVIYGNAKGAQLAWNNGAVSQSHAGEPQQITEGFEALATVVAEILRQLPATGLSGEDQAIAAEAGNEILAQITQPVPEHGKLKRAAATLRGVLVQLAIAAETGVGQAVTEWVKAAVKHLSTLVS